MKYTRKQRFTLNSLYGRFLMMSIITTNPQNLSHLEKWKIQCFTIGQIIYQRCQKILQRSCYPKSVMWMVINFTGCQFAQSLEILLLSLQNYNWNRWTMQKLFLLMPHSRLLHQGQRIFINCSSFVGKHMDIFIHWCMSWWLTKEAISISRYLLKN